MIRTKMNMWCIWSLIALRQVGSATKARNEGVPAWKYEADSSASISAEFERSVTSISACAFAMEALSKELETAGHVLDKAKIKPTTKVSAGYYVGHHIIQALALTGAFANGLPSALDHVFTMRNDAVHFESEWKDGVHYHPSGTEVAYEMALYTLEEALKSVNLVHRTFIEIESSVAQQKYDPAAGHIANEISGVHAMFDEVSRLEGVKLLEECSSR